MPTTKSSKSGISTNEICDTKTKNVLNVARNRHIPTYAGMLGAGTYLYVIDWLATISKNVLPIILA